MPGAVNIFKAALQSSTSIANGSNLDARGIPSFYLAGVEAIGAHLPGATFQPCVPNDVNKNNNAMICTPNKISDLTGINLTNAFLHSVCFDSALLKNAKLDGAVFTNGSAQKTDFTGATISNIVATDAIFCGAIMPDGKICNGKSWTGQGVTIACNCQSKTTS